MRTLRTLSAGKGTDEMDQCIHCTVRGNYDECQDTPCSNHENWINIQRIKIIDRLRAAIDELKRERDEARADAVDMADLVTVATRMNALINRTPPEKIPAFNQATTILKKYEVTDAG